MSFRKSYKIIGLEEGWTQIKEQGLDLIESIIQDGFNSKDDALISQDSYIRVYTIAYTMCVQKGNDNHGAELDKRRKIYITDFIKKHFVPKLTTCQNEVLLQEFLLSVDKYKILTNWYYKFFGYLNIYHKIYSQTSSFGDVATEIFKVNVFDVFKANLSQTMIELINMDRNNYMIDRNIIRDVLEFYLHCGDDKCVYNDFENLYITATQQFYKDRGETWIETCSIPVYLEHVERAIALEDARSHSFFVVEDTMQKVEKTVKVQLVVKHKDTILLREDSGYIIMIKREQLKILEQMFQLFLKCDILDDMVLQFKKYVLNILHGTLSATRSSITTDPASETNDNPQLIKEMIVHFDKFNKIVCDCFSSNMLFVNALYDAFRKIMNSSVGKYTMNELLNVFCDRLLKSGNSEKMSDASIESVLDSVIQLFTFIADKDVFADGYKNYLAKRLLNQRSASDEMERFIIGKLKLKCGPQFTCKFEGMLNDLSLCLENMEEYHKHAPDHNISDIDFNTQLLTVGHWPTYKNVHVNMPLEMERCKQSYKDFYDHKTPGRRLHWINSLGTVVIKSTFGGKTYEMQVSTLQACVITAFCDTNSVNAHDGTITFKHLQKQLEIDEDVLKRILHSLACGKFRILRKFAGDPADEKKAIIKTGDSFQVNKKFASPTRKFRIPMASLDDVSNTKKVEEDRSFAIDAAIVRIMKARKQMTHQELLAEVVSILIFFKPEIKLVKKRIEGLIERDYLERDEENTSVYKYIA